MTLSKQSLAALVHDRSIFSAMYFRVLVEQSVLNTNNLKQI